MDHAKRMSADDSLIVKVKTSVETGSIHRYILIRFRLSVTIGNWNRLGRYTSCKFAMVECRRFAVGILMICYVTISAILVFPVSWLPSWFLAHIDIPWHRQYHYTRKLDPENIEVAVGILLLPALDVEICLGAISALPFPANVAKNCCLEKG